MVSITFKVNGSDVQINANEGDNLLAAAQRANVAIDAPCSGNGACGKCRVRLVSGELDSPGRGTSPRRSTPRAGGSPASARSKQT